MDVTVACCRSFPVVPVEPGGGWNRFPAMERSSADSRLLANTDISHDQLTNLVDFVSQLIDIRNLAIGNSLEVFPGPGIARTSTI